MFTETEEARAERERASEAIKVATEGSRASPSRSTASPSCLRSPSAGINGVSEATSTERSPRSS